jgi:hypothetical protein
MYGRSYQTKAIKKKNGLDSCELFRVSNKSKNYVHAYVFRNCLREWKNAWRCGDVYSTVHHSRRNNMLKPRRA